MKQIERSKTITSSEKAESVKPATKGELVSLKLPGKFSYSPVQEVSGSMVSLAADTKHEYVAIKHGTGSWTIVEKTTGLQPGKTWSKTKAEAIILANKNIETFGRDKLARAIETADKLNEEIDMKINEKKLIKLDACKEDIEMFRRYPGLEGGCADVGALCRWAASEGKPGYVRWLLPRLMTPEKAVGWVILAVKRHCTDAEWNEWADGRRSGKDQTPKPMQGATDAKLTEIGAVWTAWATWITWAAEYACDAAEDKPAEIERQIADALKILSVDGKKEV